MSEYAVITQNDESPWDDIKGDLYHYPAMYQSILTPGCRIAYYKGRMLKPEFAKERLSPRPHYFGVGVVGGSIADPTPRRRTATARSSITRISRSLFRQRSATNIWREYLRRKLQTIGVSVFVKSLRMTSRRYVIRPRYRVTRVDCHIRLEIFKASDQWRGRRERAILRTMNGIHSTVAKLSNFTDSTAWLAE